MSILRRNPYICCLYWKTHWAISLHFNLHYMFNNVISHLTKAIFFSTENISVHKLIKTPYKHTHFEKKIYIHNRDMNFTWKIDSSHQPPDVGVFCTLLLTSSKTFCCAVLCAKKLSFLKDKGRK